MTSIAQITEMLEQILEVEAEQLAKDVGFIQRERAFSGADFAQTLILGWLQQPEVTLDGLTQILQRREVTITAAGLTQRFTPQAAAFLEGLLERLSQVRLQAEAVDIALLKRFSAVVVEDSSLVTLPHELATSWSGCGGSAGASPAAVKLFVRWDVLAGSLQGPRLSDGRHSDKRSPFLAEEVPEGGLYLADLGFFGVERLSRLAQPATGQKRYFVSRLQTGPALFTRAGHRIELRGILPAQVGQALEMGVLLGKQQRLPVRLLMVRVPEDVAEQRRQRIREAAQDQGREPSQEVLYVAQWTLLVTNVPARRLSIEEALVLCRLRWQIERLFRLWKEYGRIDEWRSKNPWRILCELYGKLAAMVIQHSLIQAGCWSDPHRSLVKAAQVVSREAGRIMVALYEGRLEQVVCSIVRSMRSGCRLNRRKCAPSTSQLLLDGLDWRLT